MFEGYLTWQALGEWGTLITVTVVLVQFALKAFADWVGNKLEIHIETKYVVYLTAAILMLLYRAVTGTLAGLDLPLVLISAVFAALAAMKLWETIATEVLGKLAPVPTTIITNHVYPDGGASSANQAGTGLGST